MKRETESNEEIISHSKKKNFILFLRRCARNPKHWKHLSTLMEKKNSSSCIQKVSFKATVLKSSATANLVGEVSKASSWVKYQCIGRGSYASVHLARSKNPQKESFRVIKSAEISRAKSLMKEEKFLTRLRSPFVVRCYGHEIAREKTLIGDREVTNYNLILEYCSGESLTNVIDIKGGLSEKDIKLYARNILYGLHYIHSENIIHCDIKPDNILLTPLDKRMRPMMYVTRIADFGLAMEKGSIEYGNGTGHMRGTSRYMAPELMRHGILDYGADIWAFGCTVLEMFTGQAPWAEHGKLDSKHLAHLIGVSDFVPYIPNWLSEEAQDFLNRCLVKETRLRWGTRELLDHPFFRMFV